MSRRLDDLCPKMRLTSFEILARLAERGIHVLIVDTLRTPEEQEEYLRKGTSWTRNSKHLAQTQCSACESLVNSFGGHGLSHAIDVAPYEVFMLHGRDKLQWDASDPAWGVIGEIAESLALRWGGRWTTPDSGHLEYQGP